MGEKKKRHGGFQGAVDIIGNRYYYVPVQVGTTTTITKREEQRAVNRLYNGQEVFDDWKVTRVWTEIH